MLMDAVTSCDTGVIQILYADLNRMPFKASNSFVAFSITPEGSAHDLGMVIRTFGSFSDVIVDNPQTRGESGKN